MRDGGQVVGRAPLSESDWFKWLGAASGALIAAGIGWIAVPNALVPTDTPDAHFRLAEASLLAAIPWAYRLARDVPNDPLKAAALLFVRTYLLGMLTIGLCGVPFPPVAVGPGPGGPIGVDGYFLSLWPWIAAGALLWTLSMLLLGSIETPLRLSFRLSALARSRAPRFVAAALVTVAVIVVAGPGVRRSGWGLPNPPAAHRPTVAGVVADNQRLSGSCRLTLGDGRTFEVSDDSCLVHGGPAAGELVLAGDAGGSWEVYLYPADWSAPNGAACWGMGDESIAWDRGDAVLFPWLEKPYGLELPKAPGFASKSVPRPFFSDLVYDANIPCVNDAGQVLFMEVPGYA